jgi:ribose 5-phosphate isomerase B
MKIAIGADHRGYEFKNKIKSWLQSRRHSVLDCGTNSEESCDYPLLAYAVAKAVQQGQADRGILFCNSGIGMAIAANKLKGIRAALCHNADSAALSRQHNNANVLVLAASEIGENAPQIIEAWLTAEFEGGRHARRVDQITEIENKN